MTDLIPAPPRPRCGDFGHKAKGSGAPCAAVVLPGLTCCWWHGAGAPQTRAKAEAMLASLRVPATQALMMIIYRWLEDPCPTCGYPRQGDSDQQRTIVATAKAIYDRTGMGPRATLEVTRPADPALDVSCYTAGELERLDELLEGLDRLKVEVADRLAQQTALAPSEVSVVPSNP